MALMNSKGSKKDAFLSGRGGKVQAKAPPAIALIDKILHFNTIQ